MVWCVLCELVLHGVCGAALGIVIVLLCLCAGACVCVCACVVLCGVVWCGAVLWCVVRCRCVCLCWFWPRPLVWSLVVVLVPVGLFDVGVWSLLSCLLLAVCLLCF